MWLTFILLAAGAALVRPEQDVSETDGSSSRKVLGSSVVTSVSVILDSGNKTQAYFADAVGKPVLKPITAGQLASPINLLNPDRYEFYTFDDNGDLVKRLMTLTEIQSIIANGDGEHFNLHLGGTPEKKVDDVVSNVQNVLKGEIAAHKPNEKPVLDTPDVSSTWSMILPTIFGNVDNNVRPEHAEPQNALTPDTITLDYSTQSPSNNQDILSVLPVTVTEQPKRPEFVTFFSVDDNKIKSTTVGQIEKQTEPAAPTAPTRDTTSMYPTTQGNKISVTIIPNAHAHSELSITDDDTTPVVTIRPQSIISSESTSSPIVSASQTTKVNTIKPVYITKQPIGLSSTTEVEKEAISTQSSKNSETTATTEKLSSVPPTLITEKHSTTIIQAEKDQTINKNQDSGDKKNAEADKNFEDTTKKDKDNISLSTSTQFTSKVTPTHQTTSENLSIKTTTSQKPSSALNYAIHESSTEILKTSASEHIRPYSSTVNYRPIIYLLTTPDNSPSQFLTTLRTNVNPVTTTIEPFTKEPTDKNKFITMQSNNEVHSDTTEKSPAKTTNKLETTSAEEALYVNEAEKSSNEIDTENPTVVTTEMMTTAEKISVTELLDQLLQSTDIYEINSQLSDVTQKTDTPKETATIASSPNALSINPITETDKVTNADDTDKKFDFTATTTESFTQTTTFNDEQTTPINFQKEENTKQSVEPSIAVNVAQLISSLNGGKAEPLIQNEKDAAQIHNMMMNSNSKPFKEVQTEAATAASGLLDNINEETTTEDKNLPLDDALSSIISQIVNDDQPTLTTITIPPTTSTKIEATETTKYIEPSTTIKSLSSELSNRFSQQNISNASSNYRTEVPHDIHVIIYRTSQATANSLLSEITSKSPADTIFTTQPKDTENLTDNSDSQTDSTTIENVAITTDLTVPSTGKNEEFTTEQIINDRQDSHNNVEVTDTNNKLETTTENFVETTYVTANPTQQMTSEMPKQPSESPTATSTSITSTTFKLSTSSTISPPSTNKITMQTSFNSSSSLSAGATKPATGSTPKPLTMDEKNVKNTDSTENSSWTLVSMVPPHSNISDKPLESAKPQLPNINIDPPKPVDLVPQPLQGFGLEDSTSTLDTDIYKFVELCNELAFGFWQSVTNGISTARSVFTSPFAATSLLAMVFLGARGSTSGEMNEILKLDDMVTFNPHLIFRNVSESIEVSPSAGVATSAIIRELYSDKSKGKLLNFYKERARQFYDGHVEEASFKEIGDIIRRRTNLLVKRSTWGKIQEYVKDVQITARPPLAGISASIFQTDCSSASTDGRDGELYFVVLPSIRQRRLIPVPAVVYRTGFLAGYDPALDATAVALGSKDQTVSTIFVIPGQQGIAAPGDGLSRLEKHLTDTAFKRGAWPRLLRSLIPRPGLEVQIPRFSHRSIINATVALQKMGLKDLFDSKKADLRGLNGVAHELHLSDLLQINTFATCGEGPIEDTHHSEIYPATATRSTRNARKLEEANAESDFADEPRDYQRAFHDPLHDPSFFSLPLNLRPRQARLPEIPRLRFDRPFLYFVRHNPTGLILHMGRFNPRLLP